tara:strand:- start:342 stop:722 length:381 start_codon:yes stop_codon:yes gene_type:complete
MSQIKFRGLLQSGAFIYGSYVTDGKDYHAILRENPDDSSGMLNTPVIPESVGQFIVLQDKSGDDYYVGDIIDYGQGRFAEIVYWEGRYTMKGLNFSDGTPSCIVDFYTYPVVGNIHENPELLEQMK